MQTTVRGVQPAECRNPPVSFPADLFAGGLQKLAHRQNAPLTDQPVDLRPKRNKGDQINKTEKSQEKPAREKNGVAFTPDESAETRQCGDGLFHPWQCSGQSGDM